MTRRASPTVASMWGDGMMIHCGDPISYANIEQQLLAGYFYAYGRLP